MSIKPILFNTEMVLAILDGRKTVTRRVVKDCDKYERLLGIELVYPIQVYEAFKRPWERGDILWVRETWTTLCGSYLYKANQKTGMKNPGKWRPSIHMPREAARIFLRVKDVRPERLQTINGSEIRREGIDGQHGFGATRGAFSALWDSTIKQQDMSRYGWRSNPWVWRGEFERCEKPEGFDG